MQITIYNNASDNRVVSKSLTAVKTLAAEMYENCSVTDPVILAAYDSALFTANYMYIPLFGRYYYIKDIQALNGRQVLIMGHVDVLMTYAAQIKSLTGIIDKNTGTGSTSMYINDGSYVTEQKTFTEVINFSNGFNDEGEYILITAGG